MLSMATAWARAEIIPSQLPLAMASVFSPFQEIIGMRSLSTSHGSRHDGKASFQE